MENLNTDQNANKPGFFRRNIVAVILAIGIVIVFGWFYMKDKNNVKRFETEKSEMSSRHKNEIDSLKVQHLQFATKVFSWSVRSEMMRNNTETLSQLLNTYAQESGADLVQLINPENQQVVLSSDKKYEGTKYNGDIDLNINAPLIVQDSGAVRLVTPIMDLNSMIGILIIEMQQNQ
jgi:hypothetical protein